MAEISRVHVGGTAYEVPAAECVYCGGPVSEGLEVEHGCPAALDVELSVALADAEREVEVRRGAR